MIHTDPTTLKKLAKPAIIVLLLIALAGLSKYFSDYIDSLTFHGKIPLLEILHTLILFALAWFATRVMEIFFWEGLIEKRLESKVPRLLKTILNSAIFLIVIIIVIGFIFNQSVAGLVATTGAVGIVVGLGLRSTMESAFNGITLSVDQVFQIGDLIAIRNTFDTPVRVLEITWRYTLFDDGNGNHVVVPNNTICAAVITNYSRPSHSTCLVIFLTCCFPSESLDRVKGIIAAAIRSTKGVQTEPPPTITIAELTEGGVKFQINYWINFNKIKPEEAKNELYQNLIHHLNVAGMGLDITSARGKDHQFLELSSQQIQTNILQRVSLFSSFTQEEIDLLASQVITLHAAVDEIIIKQGEEGDSMYVLAEGLLKVDIEDEETKKVFTVGKISPGQFFGEMSLLVGDPRSATITALVESVVYEIHKPVMQKLFERYPDLVQSIGNKIAERHVNNLKKKQALLDSEIESKTKGYADQFCSMIKKWFGRT